MKKNLSKIVDLVKYPIHDLQRDKPPTSSASHLRQHP